MNYYDNTKLQRVIGIARAILETYAKLQSADGNFGNPDIQSAIHSQAEFVRRWLDILDDQPSPEEINDVWREVHHISRILEGPWKPRELSNQMDQLQHDLFGAMLDLLVEVRKQR